MTTRRTLLAGAAALLASGCKATSATPLPPLKSLVPYALGTCAMTAQLDDPEWARLATRHFSRLTPEWEMKMEYMLLDDGSLRFDRPDAIVDFATRNGMTVHGHNLIWYAQSSPYFETLRGDKFLNAYVGYIHGVMDHYKGRLPSWDVVNEPITDEGGELRDCLWSQALGREDYVGLALTAAHEADPSAVLFVNDYNLEHTPKKRATFLKLCETLLRNGAPLHGVGSQSHIIADIAPGMIKTSIRDLASLGLKLHMSEIDISTRESHLGLGAEKAQIRVLNELVEAYDQVPSAQRYGLTFWGVRDGDSWRNREQGLHLPDAPLLFDDEGRTKPLTEAFAAAVRP
jgi:endo-1,4-beta-xylanase